MGEGQTERPRCTPTKPASQVRGYGLRHGAFAGMNWQPSVGAYFHQVKGAGRQQGQPDALKGGMVRAPRRAAHRPRSSAGDARQQRPATRGARKRVREHQGEGKGPTCEIEKAAPPCMVKEYGEGHHSPVSRESQPPPEARTSR